MFINVSFIKKMRFVNARAIDAWQDIKKKTVAVSDGEIMGRMSSIFKCC